MLYVLGAGAVEYAVLAYSLGHRGLPLAPVAVVLDTLQAPSLALFPPVILLFPDGPLTSRRWRRVLWVYAALTIYVSVVSVAQAVAAVAGHDIRLGTSGSRRACQASIPPASGRTLWMPSRFSLSATRALEISLGQEQ